MKNLRNQLILLFTISCSFSFAQVGGNQLYQQNGNYTQRYNYNPASATSKQSIYSTDSTLVVSANILMSKMADSYLVSLGANQEGKTLEACNTEINNRLSALVKSLSSIGVTEESVYIDFVSQAKIYDYEQTQNQANQVQAGFEIKKNVLIRLDDLDKFDRLIELCAKQGVHDIIQVEYRNVNTDAIYNQLFEEALSVINARKAMYLKATGQTVQKTSKIVSDYFYNLMPKDMYKAYEATESSKLIYNSTYYNSNLQFFTKEARKSKTFYYQQLGSSGFDRVLDQATPKIGVQYIFSMQMEYRIVKS